MGAALKIENIYTHLLLFPSIGKGLLFYFSGETPFIIFQNTTFSCIKVWELFCLRKINNERIKIAFDECEIE